RRRRPNSVRQGSVEQQTGGRTWALGGRNCQSEAARQRAAGNGSEIRSAFQSRAFVSAVRAIRGRLKNRTAAAQTAAATTRERPRLFSAQLLRSVAARETNVSWCILNRARLFVRRVRGPQLLDLSRAHVAGCDQKIENGRRGWSGRAQTIRIAGSIIGDGIGFVFVDERGRPVREDLPAGAADWSRSGREFSFHGVRRLLCRGFFETARPGCRFVSRVFEN